MDVFLLEMNTTETVQEQEVPTRTTQVFSTLDRALLSAYQAIGKFVIDWEASDLGDFERENKLPGEAFSIVLKAAEGDAEAEVTRFEVH